MRMKVKKARIRQFGAGRRVRARHDAAHFKAEDFGKGPLALGAWRGALGAGQAADGENGEGHGKGTCMPLTGKMVKVDEDVKVFQS